MNTFEHILLWLSAFAGAGIGAFLAVWFPGNKKRSSGDRPDEIYNPRKKYTAHPHFVCSHPLDCKAPHCTCPLKEIKQ